VYLSNALPQGTIDKAFSLSKEFFGKTLSEKMKVEWESFVGKRGFVMKGAPCVELDLIFCTGREQIFDPDDMVVVRQDGKFEKTATMKLYQSIKEPYELGREPSLNQFPANWPEFKEFWDILCDMQQSLSAGTIGAGSRFRIAREILWEIMR
jgi:hypothetical protein